MNGMRERLGSIGRWLRHPTLTLASNVWFLITLAIGAGTLVAGLVGGFLSALTSVPVVWLIVAAVGAFLVTAAGIGLLVQPWLANQATAPTPQLPVDPHDIERRQGLRRSIGRILTELEMTKGALEGPNATGRLPLVLRTSEWEAQGDDLAIDGLFDAHRATRIAYRHISELNREMYRSITKVEETLDTVRDAIKELEGSAKTTQ